MPIIPGRVSRRSGVPYVHVEWARGCSHTAVFVISGIPDGLKVGGQICLEAKQGGARTLMSEMSEFCGKYMFNFDSLDPELFSQILPLNSNFVYR